MHTIQFESEALTIEPEVEEQFVIDDQCSFITANLTREQLRKLAVAVGNACSAAGIGQRVYARDTETFLANAESAAKESCQDVNNDDRRRAFETHCLMTLYRDKLIDLGYAPAKPAVVAVEVKAAPKLAEVA